MKNSRQILAGNIVRLMEVRGIRAPADLAKLLKTGHSQVYRVLEGSISTTIDSVDKYAKALGVEPWELLTDSEETRKRAIERLLNRT